MNSQSLFYQYAVYGIAATMVLNTICSCQLPQHIEQSNEIIYGIQCTAINASGAVTGTGMRHDFR